MSLRAILSIFAVLILFGAAMPAARAQGIVVLIGPDGVPPWQRVRPHHHPHQPIRIQKHAVRAVIDGGVAKTTIEQVFSNPNPYVLEGTYVFPVSDQASITEFTMVMNGKTVKGEVLEKDKARQIYEDIVRTMRDPALLEWVGSRLFQARVFPINPGAPVEISLTYVEQLKAEGGICEYRYPLKTQQFTSAPVESVSVHATITSPTAIKSVFSSSHQIEKVQKGDHEVVVSFEGKQVEAAKDFHLFYTLADGAFGMHLLSDMSAADGGYFMLTLAPKQSHDQDAILPKDVVFVADTSGSMREDKKMEQAVQALKYGVKGLRKGDRFNIIAFATEARSFADKAVEVSDAAVAEALQWIEQLEANGGTNIADALQTALKTLPQEEGRLGMVVFMTDGMPTVGETRPPAIVKAVAAANVRHARLFIFGVGYDVNAQLLDTLAEESRGARDYVTPSQNVEVVLGRFFDRVSYPVLADLAITVDGVRVDEVYPKVLPDLFKGGELTLFGRYTGSGPQAIRLKGKVGKQEKEYVFEGKFADAKTGRDFIAPLWARRKVGYLWDQIRLNGEQKELREEIVRLGKKFGIATPYTSFLVTEDRPTARRLQDHGGFVPGGGATGGGGRETDGRGFDDAWGLRQAEPRADADAASPAEVGRVELGERNAPPAPKAAPPPVAGEGAVTLSLAVDELRKSTVGAETKRPAAEVTVERFADKTFELRRGVWVDTAIDVLSKADFDARLAKIAAFSVAYFDLVREMPELAKILARFPTVMVELRGKVILITPAAEEAEKPAAQPESRKS
jgi:Ca-activated chloride channel homolog